MIVLTSSKIVFKIATSTVSRKKQGDCIRTCCTLLNNLILSHLTTYFSFAVGNSLVSLIEFEYSPGHEEDDCSDRGCVADDTSPYRDRIFYLTK